MYTYTSGYNQEEVYMSAGQTLGGCAIGIIRIGALWFPYMPGNINNPTTFNFPVYYKWMEGSPGIDQIITTEPDPAFLEKAIKAAKALEQMGCRAIIGSCGYFASFLTEIATAVNVPCFLSSLMQVPIISRALKPTQKVGIICANGRVLSSAPALEACRIDPSTIVIAGAENLSQMQNVIQSRGHLNNVKFEQELVMLAKEMVTNNPDVGAILLECTEMPPYAWAIQKAVRLPVFDFTTMVNWVYNAVVRRPFTGFI